jgi:choline dehydrogenase
MSPNPSMMSNAAFAADAIAGFDEIPARGPYTLAMGNSAVYISLPNITANYTQIIEKVNAQLASSSTAGLFLPASADETVIAGYKHQLSILAQVFANPTHPVLESPFSGGVSGVSFHLKPLSRGTVMLDLEDIDGRPVIDYRTCTNPVDFDIMSSFIRYFRTMFQGTTLKSYGAVETSPGPMVQTDAEMRAYIADQATMSFMHPCCTAAMMPRQKGGVVGPELKVHGLSGLRVVDLSIMPLIIGSHTSATAYAVGEKVSTRGHSLL